jgi:hypothetical protein
MSKSSWEPRKFNYRSPIRDQKWKKMSELEERHQKWGLEEVLKRKVEVKTLATSPIDKSHQKNF